MAVAAADGDARLRPGDVRLRAALGVAVDGAGAAWWGRSSPVREPAVGSKVTSTMPSPCSPPMTGVPGTGWHVEHGTPPARLRRRLDVRRVRPADVSGEEARIARRVRLVSRAVARRAREHAARLVVATRARRRARRRLGHARRARRSVRRGSAPHAFGSSGRASATSATRGGSRRESPVERGSMMLGSCTPA